MFLCSIFIVYSGWYVIVTVLRFNYDQPDFIILHFCVFYQIWTPVITAMVTVLNFVRSLLLITSPSVVVLKDLRYKVTAQLAAKVCPMMVSGSNQYYSCKGGVKRR